MHDAGAVQRREPVCRLTDDVERLWQRQGTARLALAQIAAGQPFESEPQPSVDVAMLDVAHHVRAIDGR
jgi:hypothetical protein